jgi:DNA-directed RNA polymerase subunit alpha
MIELENAQIESVELASATFGKYEASPLPAGYGVTLGNALRRVLLSSLDGAAVTSVQIRDVPHEFSTIPGVKEDVIEMLLNLKRLRLKSYVSHPTQLKLHKSGAGPVTAADISESSDVEIVNPDLHLLTLEAGAEIEMDLTVERGVGYLAAEETKELPIGVVPVDAIFTPIRRVDYHVENTRVGQMTNYDKLTLEIETDGTVSPEDALSRAAEILVSQFSQFTTAGRRFTTEDEAGGGADQLPPNVLDMPIEDLDLPMRAYNSLKRNNIVKVGQLLQLQDEDLLRMRNFGRKSLDEMKDRLRMRGFLPPDDADAIDDLDLDDEPLDDEDEGDEEDEA